MNNQNPQPLSPQEISALVALVNQGRAREAELGARSLLPAYPDAGMLWKILSVALLRQGRDAVPALHRAAQLMPADIEAQTNLGDALHDRAEWAEALQAFERALTLEPKNIPALIRAADALKELGRANEALPLYHRALRLEPRNVEALNNLGTAFLRLGQLADAVGHYRLALTVTPDDPQILCNLGTAQRRLGYLDEALAVTRRALEIQPSSMAHTHLGLILAASGERESAIAAYRQALILNSDEVDALNNLAHLLRDIGLRRDAVALYARAIKNAPDRADTHCSLGMVLFEMRRVEDATAAFRHALSLQPNYAAAHLNLGLALRQQRMPAEAEASCRAALGIDPEYVDALAFLGELHADRGQFAAAEALFRKAIAINPGFAPAFSSIATHRKMTAADADWARTAETLLAKPMPIAHEIGLRYSLGKYHDDLKDYDSAFEHYQCANLLSKRLGPLFDGAKLVNHVSDIEHAFDVGFFERRRAIDAREEAPILIIGMPRSGTSLAEQILASHPQVFGAGEVMFWNAAYHAYQTAERGGDRNGARGAAIIAHKADEYLRLLQSRSGAAQRVVDKLPANFLYAGMIHAALPNARIIHMQRHPIDTCLSIYFQHFFNIGPYANDLNDLTHYYREYARILNHWRNVLPANALLEVPYEGLLEDQEGWTRRMLDFVGLPWDPKCLAFDQTERVVITASKWQVRQKIHKASAGRWRHYERHLGPLSSLHDLIPHALRT